MDAWEVVAVWMWVAACASGVVIGYGVLIVDSIAAHQYERNRAMERKTCKVCEETKLAKHFPQKSNKCKRCTTMEKANDPEQRKQWVDFYMRGIGPRDY
jgi:hypothetical protein